MATQRRLFINTFLDGWIEVMWDVAEQRRPFNIKFWQGETYQPDIVRRKAASLHKCGSPACGGGHLAVSKFWRDLGGGICKKTGAPTLGNYDGSHAITGVICNSDKTKIQRNISAIVSGSQKVFGHRIVPMEQAITAEDFLNVLIRYRDTGSAFINPAVNDVSTR